MNYEDYTHHNHHSGFGEYQGYLGSALPSDGGKKEEIDIKVYNYNLNQLTRFGELVMRSLRNRLKG